jgi:hypothetical protein
MSKIRDVIKAMYKIKNETATLSDKQLFIQFVNDDRQLFDKKEWGLGYGDSICAVASEHQSAWHYVIDKYYTLDSNYIFQIKS